MKKSLRLALGTFVVSASALAATPAYAQQATITNIQSFGSGCPNGSAQMSMIRSQQHGPFDVAEVKMNRYDVQLHRSSSKWELQCKVEVYVKVPAGYTIDTLNVHTEGRIRLDRGAEVTILNDLTTRGLGYGSTVHQKQMGYRVNSFVNIPINGHTKFDGIGANTGGDCSRERIVRLTVNTRSIIRHRGARDHSRYQIFNARYSLPMVNGSTAIPCQSDNGSGGGNGGGHDDWGNDWGWGW